jgi:hypothetical protein
MASWNRLLVFWLGCASAIKKKLVTTKICGLTFQRINKSQFVLIKKKVRWIEKLCLKGKKNLGAKKSTG